MVRSVKQEEEMNIPSTSLPSTASSNQSGSNDFVKKLFQMLQEDSYKDVVRWTTNGDSFVVLNTNEFTKEILPRHFKHSNFASFVRQLNKYDFHKVKIPNEEKQNYQYGDDAWEFKHPDFRFNDRESLENIKRKGPSTKKNAVTTLAGQSTNGAVTSYGISEQIIAQNQNQIQVLKDEVNLLKIENKSLHQDISILSTKYKTLIENIVAIKSFDERYYRSMGILVHCLVQAGIKLPPLDFPNPNLVSMQGPPPASNPANTLPDQAQPQQPGHSHSSSLTHLNTHNQSPYLQNSNKTQHLTPPSNENVTPPQQLVNINPAVAASPAIPTNPAIAPTTTQQSPRQGSTSQTTDINPQVTTTNLPNPKFHVLLVEDDNVCIQLCRKFLVKYGCQVTVVTDGLNAISTVENTKYDLVLMDIVMPNLDGATATSVIRSFDTKTPIIAMTGNIEDNDLVTYLQNGMSDILAKPFTKDDLYSILSKHLLTSADSATSASPPSNSRIPSGTQPPAPRTNELDLASLQGPPQQSLILPQEQPTNGDAPVNGNGDNLSEPLLKKQRL